MGRTTRAYFTSVSGGVKGVSGAAAAGSKAPTGVRHDADWYIVDDDPLDGAYGLRMGEKRTPSSAATLYGECAIEPLAGGAEVVLRRLTEAERASLATVRGGSTGPQTKAHGPLLRSFEAEQAGSSGDGAASSGDAPREV